jgi:hypothetical protein
MNVCRCIVHSFNQNRNKNVEHARRILLTPHTESMNYATTLFMQPTTLQLSYVEIRQMSPPSDSKYIRFTLKQVRKCRGGSRGIAPLFRLPPCQTPRPVRFTHGKKEPDPIVQRAGWASVPVWAGGENFPRPGFDPRTSRP